MEQTGMVLWLAWAANGAWWPALWGRRHGVPMIMDGLSDSGGRGVNYLIWRWSNRSFGSLFSRVSLLPINTLTTDSLMAGEGFDMRTLHERISFMLSSFNTGMGL
ncbi:hypothetical protein GGS24DRAFT_269567 [Hypoxylon argillaceum]|nr:hypothetical protein GGS24DRAFT_269567 [Hypoxylon argillaceum]